MGRQPMWILALDTSTRGGSLALGQDGGVLATATGDSSRMHGERLPGELLSLVGKAGLALSEIDLFAVSSGPGSFTGLRVGLATIQALALLHGRRVVQIGTLEALAHTPGPGD
ncbi:MAG: tRNA (adenosine(37)-N6)-threonylcarbamoyltransferase complex dimerization subunit type 1 TsaB, partial [Acidobacteria bacterium]|nr:tRNA (adenosine(37)-N6)-threonylcarbamoyltransferase complex dimerization subunit type 1 TsaB [Acidobacteriota bacterium]